MALNICGLGCSDYHNLSLGQDPKTPVKTRPKMIEQVKTVGVDVKVPTGSGEPDSDEEVPPPP